ncbi:hypothetical protein GCM10007968_09340 [Sporolactobacillus putidus]|uniref:Uncharacterized protein n=1 Tax=Sporolactobacillus putidus TaxID=492735 RepID=A0A917S0S4_9BACL|nr:hypothetical protein GCM10007968_09340 [Sporolactobacillus putidus]
MNESTLTDRAIHVNITLTDRVLICLISVWPNGRSSFHAKVTALCLQVLKEKRRQ